MANIIWCASVVLPAPGVPARRLKENSGSPPPRIVSSPGTPVSRRRIGTRFFMDVTPGSPGRSSINRAEQARSQLFADQRVQQLVEILREGAARLRCALRRFGLEAGMERLKRRLSLGRVTR